MAEQTPTPPVSFAELNFSFSELKAAYESASLATNTLRNTLRGFCESRGIHYVLASDKKLGALTTSETFKLAQLIINASKEPEQK